MWTCPSCHKTYKTVSQYHSCYNLSIDDHFRDKPENIKEIVLALLDYCKRAPQQELNIVKTGIMVKCESNFLSLYPTKNQVTIEFQLPYFTDEFPIAFSKRISKNRVFCKVKLGHIDEVDDQIKKWIKESYELITGVAFI